MERWRNDTSLADNGNVPEAPDLQVLREYIAPRVLSESIVAAKVLRPLVVRNLVEEPFVEHIPGRSIDHLHRKGKLMIFNLSGGFSLVVSPMLTGETWLVEPGRRMLKSTVLVLDLSSGAQLRYTDAKRMGQIYYVSSDGVSEITRIADQAPDVLDDPLTFSAFEAALKRFRGEIKGVLTRGQLVAGIGNAYADEVLWQARIYPFRKVSKLSKSDIHRLYDATYQVPEQAVIKLREKFGQNHPRKERGFLAVHGKAGKRCPTCEATISSIKSRQRDTNFCRACQPGTLFE